MILDEIIDLARLHWYSLRFSLRAARESLSFDPGRYADTQFLRLVNYRRIEAELGSRYPNAGSSIRAVEFGGSNGLIQAMLPAADFVVAPNFPECDIHDLSAWPSAHYDLVVVDQVLEHIENPARAIAELYSRLKPGGLLIATTPFLIKIHGYPHDFQRWTPAGLKREFAQFAQVNVHTWGSRHAQRTITKFGWVSCKRARQLLVAGTWNEEEWPIDCLTLAIK